MIGSNSTMSAGIVRICSGVLDPLWDPEVRVTLLDPLPNNISNAFDFATQITLL